MNGSLRCFRCRQVGHRKKECPQAPRSLQGTRGKGCCCCCRCNKRVFVCFGCGQEGHKVGYCPQKRTKATIPSTDQAGELESSRQMIVQPKDDAGGMSDREVKKRNYVAMMAQDGKYVEEGSHRETDVMTTLRGLGENHSS
ncbi:hypothetical protein Dimus_028562 [Dionaea muscipula]